jgi:hypothetical protein
VLYSAGENGNAIGSFSFDSLSMPTRDFTVTLSGEAIGKMDPSGTYAISLVSTAATVSPVPEPMSGLMLVGGLGVLGLFKRRTAKC